MAGYKRKVVSSATRLRPHIHHSKKMMGGREESHRGLHATVIYDRPLSALPSSKEDIYRRIAKAFLDHHFHRGGDLGRNTDNYGVSDAVSSEGFLIIFAQAVSVPGYIEAVLPLAAISAPVPVPAEAPTTEALIQYEDDFAPSGSELESARPASDGPPTDRRKGKGQRLTQAEAEEWEARITKTLTPTPKRAAGVRVSPTACTLSAAATPIVAIIYQKE